MIDPCAIRWLCTEGRFSGDEFCVTAALVVLSCVAACP